MEQGLRGDISLQKEVAVLVAVHLDGEFMDEHDPLGELRALAETAGVRVAATVEQYRKQPEGRSYLGSGKLEELARIVADTGAKVVIFDNELAPSQIQVLEKATKCKVLDRSELILDIFANRATTRAAILQVEIAQLEYVAPRLRAMWSHLGQVTGGAPMGVGTRGPGEQQIEIDRRIVKRRLSTLKRELDQVLARRAREVAERRHAHFTACLVGYTNAGKSSLFNALTSGGAFANDQLFATLMTRIESWNLGEGDSILLGDTVGFIRNLPHHLVASFRATLEDAIHAHALLVVVDAADRNAHHQFATVCSVLDEIGATTQPRILVLNKADAVVGGDRAQLEREWQREAESCLTMRVVSAQTGEGLASLADTVRQLRAGDVREVEVTLAASQGKAIDFLERRASVVSREWEADQVRLRVRVGRGQLEQLLAGGVPLVINGTRGKQGVDDAFGAMSPASAASPDRAERTPPHERLHPD